MTLVSSLAGRLISEESEAMTNTKIHTLSHPPSSAHEFRLIGPDDLRDALKNGYNDFKEKPSHAIMLTVLYPVVGLFLMRLSAGYDILYLTFPIFAGFALIGPLAAIGLYEMSRRREKGLDVSWSHAAGIVRSPSIFAIAQLSVLVGVIYMAWLGSAHIIFWATFGGVIPNSITEFALQIATTSAGWTLILVGCGVGFIFATVVLAISVVSFPMLLDRDVSAWVAVKTSVNATLANPMTMAMWGIIVVGLLAIGSLPFLFGLAITMPVLGHATWHLYRKIIV